MGLVFAMASRVVGVMVGSEVLCARGEGMGMCGCSASFGVYRESQKSSRLRLSLSFFLSFSVSSLAASPVFVCFCLRLVFVCVCVCLLCIPETIAETPPKSMYPFLRVTPPLEHKTHYISISLVFFWFLARARIPKKSKYRRSTLACLCKCVICLSLSAAG